MMKAKRIAIVLAAMCLLTIGALGLIGCDGHSHSMRKVKEAEATCLEDGTAEYYVCKDCNKMFADRKGETEISAPEIIPALGHDWDTEWTSADGKHFKWCLRDDCDEIKDEGDCVYKTVQSLNTRHKIECEICGDFRYEDCTLTHEGAIYSCDECGFSMTRFGADDGQWDGPNRNNKICTNGLISNFYIGSNWGQHYTMRIRFDADTEGDVQFLFEVSTNTANMSVTDYFKLWLNDEKITSNSSLPTGPDRDDWTFHIRTVGTYHVNEGENTLYCEMDPTVSDRDDPAYNACYNFKAMYISGAGNYTWLPSHDLEHVERKESCTEDGNIEYWHCKDCKYGTPGTPWIYSGCYFADEACTQKITEESTELGPIGHNFVANNGVMKCTRCGTENNCDLPLVYTDNGDGTHTGRCDTCNDVSAAEAHTFSDADGYSNRSDCTKCGASVFTIEAESAVFSNPNGKELDHQYRILSDNDTRKEHSGIGYVSSHYGGIKMSYTFYSDKTCTGKLYYYFDGINWCMSNTAFIFSSMTLNGKGIGGVAVNGTAGWYTWVRTDGVVIPIEQGINVIEFITTENLLMENTTNYVHFDKMEIEAPAALYFDEDASGCDYSDWTVVTMPTQDAAGEMIRYCAHCYGKQSVTLPALTFGGYTVRDIAATEYTAAKTEYTVTVDGKSYTFYVYGESAVGTQIGTDVLPKQGKITLTGAENKNEYLYFEGDNLGAWQRSGLYTIKVDSSASATASLKFTFAIGGGSAHYEMALIMKVNGKLIAFSPDQTVENSDCVARFELEQGENTIDILFCAKYSWNISKTTVTSASTVTVIEPSA